MRELALPCPPRSFDEPAARPAERRPLPVVPEHVRLDVRIDPDAQTVSGRVTHTVRARAVPVRRLTIDAADLVAEVPEGEGIEAIVHQGGIELRLDVPIPPGEQYTFSLDFVAEPTCGLFFVPAEDGRPPQAWTQGAMEDHHHWFPCFDAPEHMVTTEVIATVPCDAGEAPDGWARFHWRHDTPHALYLLTLVVDALATVRDERAPVLSIHYVPPGREADAEQIFARMPEMYRYFAHATGVPYPYPRYGHVFLRRFMWGGMENTTLTSLTDLMLVPGDLRDDFDVERLIAHELAHQWFGDLIAPRGWPEIWLNESFASYFEILCMQALNGDDDLFRRILTERDSYFSEAAHRYTRPVVTRNYAHPYVLFDRHAYEKGCLVLHTLRAQIGDAAFWAGLRAYVQRCRGEAAETALLRQCMEAASGLDLSTFFEHFVYGAGHPTVAMDWRYDPQVGLELTIIRTDDGDHQLYVDVLIQGATARTVRMRITGETRTLVLPLDAPPRWVAIDPEQRCLLRINEERETTEVLLERLRADAPMLRVRTAQVLADRADPRVTQALATILEGDEFEVVRLEAAKALGAHRTDAARAALAKAVEHAPSWRVKEAAARAFGVGAERAQLQQLDTWLAQPQRYPVKVALLSAVGKIRDDAAASLAEKHLDAASPRACVNIAAAHALAAQERPAALDTLLLRTEPGHHRSLRTAALAGAAKLAKVEGVKSADKRRVRETLERALFDELFQVRLAATDALKTLGDGAAKAALERAHGAERSAMIRRFHREALGALG